ncbi:uncharacterized protein LOC122316237 [Carya illinoinensis]|uniref:uncharacterized protein LOC122316237 n=1 Tax=Carya illinoinensis TaxID=32201 RepID=UPI001C7196D2|nr:uncharacterized protein LOC122316237 [Carya illinoinensis]
MGIDGCIARLNRKVDRNMNILLDAKFSAGEVKEALFQMNPLGSPGPDGFLAKFYQVHWDIVGDKVTQAVLEVLNLGGDISGINKTFIVLIPKVKGPKTVMDFRPISLCNVLYKVVSKVLSNRLKMILPQIVSPTQSAFVPGRLILDNVIVAFETMHSISIKGGRQQGHMAIKLDMSKAYDRVEWDFLRAVMIKLGFTEKWIRAQVEEWVTINSLLSTYEGASGQKINKDKTSIYFSANTRPETKEYILRIASTKATTCYERYLGPPSLVGRSRYKAFTSILDRVRNRVSNWKTKLLSQEGKEILLKVVIQALSMYSMGVFKLPKVLLKEIDRVMNQFWWGQQDKGNKVHWLPKYSRQNTSEALVSFKPNWGHDHHLFGGVFGLQELSLRKDLCGELAMGRRPESGRIDGYLNHHPLWFRDTGKTLMRKLNSEETADHILWNCPSAMDVWSNGPKTLQKSSVRAESFVKIVEGLKDQCDLQTMEAFAMTARGIWQRRNKFVFEGSFLHPKALAQNAAHQLDDFRVAQVVPVSVSQMHTSHASSWIPPPEGVVKINWDAALSEARDRVDFGLVARDHEGGVIVVKKVSKGGCVVPLLAEAIGGLQAAIFASELNLSSMILEGDSLQVVQGLSLHKERWDSVGLVMSDTRDLLTRFVHFSVSFVKRCGNQKAHCLAKEALELPEESSTMVIQPNCNMFSSLSLS